MNKHPIGSFWNPPLERSKPIYPFETKSSTVSFNDRVTFISLASMFMAINLRAQRPRILEHSLRLRAAFSNVRCISTTTSKMNAENPAKMLHINGTRKIAYRQHMGTKSPGVVFLCGFLSNMQGVKAKMLHNLCVENDNSFLRFDYEGVGESPGKFKDMHLGIWKENVLTALDKLTTGPQVIVGSSMGAWLMFLAAQERKERLHSLCGISSAINFTDRIYQTFPKEVKDRIAAGEEVIIPGPYGAYPVTKNFLEESRKCFLLMDSSIPIQCPVRLMHSIYDKDAPFETSIMLAKRLESKDVDVFLCKNADHQMSDDFSLTRLQNIVKTLLSK